jgi:hypothetical protein
MVVSEPRLIYARRPDTDPEAEINALSAAYRFIIDCKAKKEGGPRITAPDDAMKGSERDRAKTIIPE